MPIQTTITWLKIASAVLIGFGLMGVLGTIPALSWPNQLFIDLAFWPLDGSPENIFPETRLFWAVFSGILCGWGVLIWQITTRLYARDPLLARSMILTSISTWFIIDSAASIAAGAPVNALFNIGFLLSFVIPLLRPAKVSPVAS